MEEVILVDETDTVTGRMEKMQAHRDGRLHRAFSAFVFNGSGQLMLQRRAPGKYHSPGLWSNTCCSHPRPGETTDEAVHRRLSEEMGFDCPLQPRGSFIYKVEFENGLTEHELDHIYTGVFDGEPKINRDEVFTWKWIEMEELKHQIRSHPEQFTFWLRYALENRSITP